MPVEWGSLLALSFEGLPPLAVRACPDVLPARATEDGCRLGEIAEWQTITTR